MTHMKAVVFKKYGLPDVLELKDVKKPTPRSNEVLVKVHAASINAWDWDLLRGTPFVNRLMFGLLKPKYKILGCDIAGRVERVGSKVKRFRQGDEVFGDLSGCGWGGFAEYVSVRDNALALKSAGMTFKTAAAIPQAALLALQGLRKGQIRPGQKVLINGASGGAGTFAVQIAKLFGAEVTGVCSTEKMKLVRSLGAEHVIDYSQTDFTRNGRLYELILDMAAYHSIFDYRRSLAPKGIYVMAGGATARIFQTMLLGPLISMTGNRKMSLLLHRPNRGLAFINELFEAGKIVPVIDRCYPLKEAAAALRYFGEGHARGKVVITLGHSKD